MHVKLILRKAVRYLIGFGIRMLSYINHRVYMSLYIPYLRTFGMRISGRPIYISASASFDGTDYSLIELGDRVVISSGVRILTHDYSISRAVEALGYQLLKEFAIIRGIKVGNNSFIGARSILLPGTEIGDNVIIGAGSVVRGKIPDNKIVMGNPAQIIGDIRDWAAHKLEDSPEYWAYIAKRDT